MYALFHPEDSHIWRKCVTNTDDVGTGTPDRDIVLNGLEKIGTSYRIYREVQHWLDSNPAYGTYFPFGRDVTTTDATTFPWLLVRIRTNILATPPDGPYAFRPFQLVGRDAIMTKDSWHTSAGTLLDLMATNDVWLASHAREFQTWADTTHPVPGTGMITQDRRALFLCTTPPRSR